MSFPAWIHLKSFFFSRSTYCSTEKWHIVMYISFLFWQIYSTICLVPVSSGYDKVSQYGFFFNKTQVAFIYSLKKRTMRVSARKAKCLQQHCNTVGEAISSGVSSSRRWGCCASLPLTVSHLHGSLRVWNVILCLLLVPEGWNPKIRLLWINHLGISLCLWFAPRWCILEFLNHLYCN